MDQSLSYREHYTKDYPPPHDAGVPSLLEHHSLRRRIGVTDPSPNSLVALHHVDGQNCGVNLLDFLIVKHEVSTNPGHLIVIMDFFDVLFAPRASGDTLRTWLDRCIKFAESMNRSVGKNCLPLDLCGFTLLPNGNLQLCHTSHIVSHILHYLLSVLSEDPAFAICNTAKFADTLLNWGITNPPDSGQSDFFVIVNYLHNLSGFKDNKDQALWFMKQFDLIMRHLNDLTSTHIQHITIKPSILEAFNERHPRGDLNQPSPALAYARLRDLNTASQRTGIPTAPIPPLVSRVVSPGRKANDAATLTASIGILATITAHLKAKPTTDQLLAFITSPMTRLTFKFFAPNNYRANTPLKWSNSSLSRGLGFIDDNSTTFTLNNQPIPIDAIAHYRVFHSIFGHTIDPVLRTCSDLTAIRAYVRRESLKHFPTTVLSQLGLRTARRGRPSN